ncbi:outer membrane lipoprotein-sorting protein [Hahella sp. CCB-MM4]|uniref:DUF1329 domain-containing protein n=1 Tax=Hahella sp. (strain CCB-MM4) TaxID=1926491 RepID=UPI000B9C4E57|nr:DUF1329 domain-containing protein [Hahella sp. CCB-MM4]OZG73896.1 outer membrane lipoprotein-sorting protein [Hahella sp. CCB-MM4]
MNANLKLRVSSLAFILSLGVGSSSVLAKISEQEVKRLDSELTPVGGERGGNVEGTIPPWTGGITQPPAGYTPGGNYVDPYANDSVVMTIDAKNFGQVQDKLSEGHKTLLKKYPTTYKMNVYPSRRSASYSEDIYKAIKKNAREATLLDLGAGVKGGSVSSPFPIPKSAEEILWNHVLRYRGDEASSRTGYAAVTSGGSYTPIMTERDIIFIYAQEELDARKLENKFFYLKVLTLSPPKQAGNISLVHESIDQVSSPRKAWQYFSGQRRLRRSPSLAYDSDLPNTDGLRTTDQYDMFNGAPDQYEWKIVGKKEMYVPYNSYRLNDKGVKYDDIIKPGHINQDLARYELHRVWVVEGNLRVGIQHLFSKRVLYFDEDSWQVLVTEEYDEDGKLWRVQEGHAMNYYDQPLVWTALEVVYDLKSDRYLVEGLDNEEPDAYNFKPGFRLNDFSTSAVRREAKR